jgi:hypothetical protein
MARQEMQPAPLAGPRGTSVLLRVIAAIAAMAALGAFGITWMEYRLQGFPDGYITDFQRCMAPIGRSGPAVFAVMAATLGFAALRPRYLRLLMAAALVLLVLYLGVSWWFGASVCFGLDHGQGG